MAEITDFLFCCSKAFINPFQIHTRDEALEVEFLEGTEAAHQRFSYEKGFQK